MTDINKYYVSAVHYPKNVRQRKLDKWSIMFRIDSQGTWVSLAGHVVEDIGGPPLPTDGIRLTETSPIKLIEGNRVTTEGGSTYDLLSPVENYRREMNRLGLSVLENKLLDEEVLKMVGDGRKDPPFVNYR